MTMMADDTECKIKNLAEEYGLSQDVLSEFAEKWNEGTSIHALTNWFNRQLIRVASDDLEQSEGSVEEYRKKVRESSMIDLDSQVLEEMQQQGIDPVKLSDDFVTPSLIRNHLRECAASSSSEERKINFVSTEESLRGMQAKTKIVFERTFQRLRQEGFVTSGDFDIEVNIRYSCNDCGDACNAFQFLLERSCSCSGEPNT